MSLIELKRFVLLKGFIRLAYYLIFAGLDQLLTENRIHDLTRMFSLFSRVKEGQKELCLTFANYLKVSCSLDVHLTVVRE